MDYLARVLARLFSKEFRCSWRPTRVRMIRTDLARVVPQLRDLSWPLRGADRWDNAAPISDLDVGTATAS